MISSFIIRRLSILLASWRSSSGVQTVYTSNKILSIRLLIQIYNLSTRSSKLMPERSLIPDQLDSFCLLLSLKQESLSGIQNTEFKYALIFFAESWLFGKWHVIIFALLYNQEYSQKYHIYELLCRAMTCHVTRLQISLAHSFFLLSFTSFHHPIISYHTYTTFAFKEVTV